MGGTNVRRLVAAGLVIGGILAAALYTNYWLSGLTEVLIHQLETGEQLATEGAWGEATSITQAAAEQWEENRFPLHALMRHTETDEIQISFHQVLEYLEQQDENLYAAANGQLITQLELLAEMEHPSWENVL